MELMNIEFVGEVKKRPELYNYTVPSYARKDIVEKSWKQVGKKFKLTAYESKEKWRNLRNAFVKNVKSCGKKKMYYLYEEMQFVLPFVKVVPYNGPGPAVPVSHLENVTENDNLSEDAMIGGDSESLDQSESQEIPPPSPTLSQGGASFVCHTSVGEKEFVSADRSIPEYFLSKKDEQQTNDVPKHSEATKMFLLSLLPDLETLTPTLLRIFKRKTLALVEELAEVPTCAPTYPSVSTFSPTNPSVSSCTPMYPSVSNCTPTDPGKSTFTPTNPSVSTCTPTYPSVSTFTPTNPGMSTFTPTNPSPVISNTEYGDRQHSPKYSPVANDNGGPTDFTVFKCKSEY